MSTTQIIDLYSNPQKHVPGQQWPAHCLIESSQDVDELFAASRIDRDDSAAFETLQDLEHLELRLDAEAMASFCLKPENEAEVGVLLVLISSLTISHMSLEVPEDQLRTFLTRLSIMLDVVEPSGLKLCLENCNFASGTAFWDILSRFPPFETLCVKGVDFASSDGIDGPGTRTLNEMQVSEIELSICAGSLAHIALVKSILGQRDGRIERVGLTIRGSFDERELDMTGYLIGFDDLQSLDIIVEPPRSDSTHNLPFDAVVDIMGSRCRQVLACVNVDVVHMTFVIPASFVPGTWDHLDECTANVVALGETAGIQVLFMYENEVELYSHQLVVDRVISQSTPTVPSIDALRC
ncbi:hypothetical protein CERSUDRAFT_126352 [Gelatoporia subvermispora B]|uniref:Uncharacterized protein n=1 Tax=Ceriporiopsis subvermispora (strain B) TaxID=914234 RepID=M2PC25_CERS8|nr:hypothetical protein CERSUDRAFT_126352 [Gelatoporia subvermispora B]